MKALVVTATCLTVATLAVVGLKRSSVDPQAATPAGAVRASVDALRSHDLNRFVELALGPERRRELEQHWDAARREDFDAADRAHYAETMGRWTASGAEEALYAELLPELEELRPQLQLMAGMMVGMAQASIGANEDLTYEERERAQALLGSLGKRLMSDELTSAENLRAAVGVLCATARELDLATLEELTALDLDEALDKGGVLLAGVQRVLAIYGLDVDAFLGSITVELLAEEAERARVWIAYDFFGSADGFEAQLVHADGRWIYAHEPLTH